MGQEDSDRTSKTWRGDCWAINLYKFLTRDELTFVGRRYVQSQNAGANKVRSRLWGVELTPWPLSRFLCPVQTSKWLLHEGMGYITPIRDLYRTAEVLYPRDDLKIPDARRPTHVSDNTAEEHGIQEQTTERNRLQSSVLEQAEAETELGDPQAVGVSGQTRELSGVAEPAEKCEGQVKGVQDSMRSIASGSSAPCLWSRWSHLADSRGKGRPQMVTVSQKFTPRRSSKG